MTFTRPALALLTIALAGTAYALRPRPERSRRQSSTRSPYFPVRNAGPKEMSLPQRRWDRVDEMVDETFPASDPPGNY